VLVNLVVNARDAVLQRAEQAPSGFRPRIDLGARVLHDEGVVEVWVADNGVGIPAEIGERVFESFFTTKGQRGGSGLGLQGARSLARSAGGDLTFTSEPGVGTTFTLRLPRSESPGNPDV
jgi:signal transduction histidine kinase